MKPGGGQRDLLTAVTGVLALVVLAFGRGWPAQTRFEGRAPLHVAYFPNLTHAPALIGVANGFLRRSLPEYTIVPRVVNAGPEAMEALLAGEVDFAYVGPSPATNTFLKSNGTALHIIAGVCSGGASLIARSNSSVFRISDLDGKTVAVPQLGGTQDVSCRTFVHQSGLRTVEEGGTVTVLPVKNADIFTLFKRKQIDAAWVPEPWASRLRDELGGRTVVDERDLWPNRRFTTTVLVVRSKFGNAHPAAVKEFLRAHADVLSWIQGHETEAKTSVNAELRRLTGKPLPFKVLDEAWAKLEFTSDPNLPNIQSLAHAAFEAGYLKSDPGLLAGLVSPPHRETTATQ